METDDFEKELEREQIEQERIELGKAAGFIANFSTYCNNLNIGITEQCFRFILPIGVVAEQSELVPNLLPDLELDKDGLADFDKLCELFIRQPYASGFLYADHFMLLASHYFRRGYSRMANYAPQFIHLFWQLNDPNIKAKIALDLDSVRVDVNNLMYKERDTWYGSQFRNAVADIKDGTVKLRPPLDINLRHVKYFFAYAYSLDIKWKTVNSIKSFYAEEFKQEDIILEIDGAVFHLVRYVHSEYNLEAKCFTHLDGAIHFYSPEQYYARRDSDFNYNTKYRTQIKATSKKLFRIDGVISVDLWIRFVSQFLAGNPLANEYFEGEYPKYLSDILPKLKSIQD